MARNSDWLDSWLGSGPKSAGDASDARDTAVEVEGIPGVILANLSPTGQRRLLAILQQNSVGPTVRFVAFRAEAFREKDLVDSFEAMIKQPHGRTTARYVPNVRPTDGDEAE